jgi:hypothetical protein
LESLIVTGKKDPAITLATHRTGHSAVFASGKTVHFTQLELGRRWALSPRTLERWRWLRQGPPYLKIGGRVVYRLEDIEQFEGLRTHNPSACGGQSNG